MNADHAEEARGAQRGSMEGSMGLGVDPRSRSVFRVPARGSWFRVLLVGGSGVRTLDSGGRI